MSSILTGASGVRKEKPILEQKIKDVHIGVFFDGTSNNMVQQAHYSTFKKVDPMGKISSKGQKNSYEDLHNLLDKKDDLLSQLRQLRGDFTPYNDPINEMVRSASGRFISKLENDLKELNEEITIKQMEAIVDTKSMAADDSKGYSNVAILYSLLNNKKYDQEALYYNIYIEGSGADDLADNNTYYISSKLDVVKGLGFGIGPRGVVALVAKACDAVYRYLSNNWYSLCEDTKYHFYVFGFSRGSTCARLFAQLATRDCGERLECEQEFKTYSKSLKPDRGKSFMEKEYLSPNVIIKRGNVFVEFLGIYDTVASIGLLQQKDGWVIGLKQYMKEFKDEDKKFHYTNASDYGLYINHNKRMKSVCHICAADEFRENFALVNIGSTIYDDSIEMIIPGCHSDVGGGYVSEKGKERVLYRFIPRELSEKERNNVDENYLKSLWRKRTKFKISKEDNPKLYVCEPWKENSDMGPLEGNTLNKLGWIDLSDSLYVDKDKKHKCQIRFADSEDELSRCVKFNKYTLGGYSNIPLLMMIKRADIKIGKELFNPPDAYYAIPDDLKSMGKEMTALMSRNGRYWVTLDDGNQGPCRLYSSEPYRRLRLKYLHFTASCQLFNWRWSLTPFFLDVDFANFGNECNYDSNRRICRIMYDGNKERPKNCNDGVKYVYNIDIKEDNIIKVNCPSPVLYSKDG